MRPGWSSSSVIHAMSAPLENVQEIPHTICASNSGTKSGYRPVVIIAMAIRGWATTIAHLRLTASASTPAGTSKIMEAMPCAAAITSGCAGVRCASTTM
jgi:hypothetical protein